MNSFPLLFHTLRHLRLRQMAYQLWYRLYLPRYVAQRPKRVQNVLPELSPFPKKAVSYEGDAFTFIQLRGEFRDWQDRRQGMLWAYNLNYMDFLLQPDMTVEEGAKWIEHFIEHLPHNCLGQDAYPTSLRIINWMKFIVLHREEISSEQRERWEVALWSQVQLLKRKLEYHLLGNHLLENFCALLVAGVYFSDLSLQHRYSQALLREIEEEYLPDGAHYEQSPMYHCILLERLLDVYNFTLSPNVALELSSFTEKLREHLQKQLGHMESILYAQDEFPLFNDSARGIALSPASLRHYAKALGLQWKALPLQACGYRKLQNARFEAFIDVGNITASYQPGHSHADSLNYELRIDGQAMVIDTGISTYEKNAHRHYERSTEAHNTVVVNHCNSSQVWGGFRVGKRATTTIESESALQISALHDGYAPRCLHHRSFELADNAFCIVDRLSLPQSDAVSLIHLAPEVRIESFSNSQVCTSQGIIHLEGAKAIEIEAVTANFYYNQALPIQKIRIHFTDYLRYSIIPHP